jgi:Flp pilus assembly protein TadD
VRERLLATFLLLAATLWVYAPVGHFEFTNYDDNEYVSANPVVLDGWSVHGVEWAFTQSHSANWHPVTWLAHMTDVELLGDDPGLQHWSNVVVHLLAAWLLLWLGWRSTGHLWASLWVALIFAVHPLHVESVAWISERKDTLSAVFAMLTLLAYREAVLRRARRWWAASLGLFALGLMAKPMLVTLPAVLLLFDVWPLRRDDPWRRRLLEKLPFAGLAALSVALTLAAQRAGHALQAADAVGMGARIANAIVQWAHYVGEMLWPRHLAVFYPHPALSPYLHGPSAIVVVGCALLLSAMTAGAVFLALRHRRRAPLVGWLLYLGMLVPVIGIVQVGQQSHADRYTYLPSIGLAIMAAAGLLWLAKRGRRARWAAIAVAAVSVVALLPVARSQVLVWRDSETLWRHAVAVTQHNWIAQNALGNALYDQGRLEGARREYAEAAASKPDYVEAHYNLANVQIRLGDTEAGLSSYRRALHYDPHHAKAMNNLGNQLARMGRYDEAIQWLERAAREQPGRWQTRYNLARALLLAGHADAARRQFERLVTERPDDARAQQGLAQARKALREGDAPR